MASPKELPFDRPPENAAEAQKWVAWAVWAVARRIITEGQAQKISTLANSFISAQRHIETGFEVRLKELEKAEVKRRKDEANE